MRTMRPFGISVSVGQDLQKQYRNSNSNFFAFLFLLNTTNISDFQVNNLLDLCYSQTCYFCIWKTNPFRKRLLHIFIHKRAPVNLGCCMGCSQWQISLFEKPVLNPLKIWSTFNCFTGNCLAFTGRHSQWELTLGKLGLLCALTTISIYLFCILS